MRAPGRDSAGWQFDVQRRCSIVLITTDQLDVFVVASIRRRSSDTFRSQFAFEHSSRRRPSKLSTKAFCTGLHGSMKFNRTPRCSLQLSIARRRNSGPYQRRFLFPSPGSSICPRDIAEAIGTGTPLIPICTAASGLRRDPQSRTLIGVAFSLCGIHTAEVILRRRRRLNALAAHVQQIGEPWFR